MVSEYASIPYTNNLTTILTKKQMVVYWGYYIWSFLRVFKTNSNDNTIQKLFDQPQYLLWEAWSLISWGEDAHFLQMISSTHRTTSLRESFLVSVHWCIPSTIEEGITNPNFKHCQRHNGPEGWIHITTSNTNLDQISSSESRPRLNLKILTNISLSIKRKLQNLDQT